MMKWLVCLVLGVATAGVALAKDRHCMFAGKSLESGAVVCDDGKQQRCSGGAWKSLGTSCARGTGRVGPGVHSPQARHAPAPQQPAQPGQAPVEQPPKP
jgi:hypothetical protein